MRLFLVLPAFFLLSLPNLLADENAGRLAELDAYWAEVSKAVGTGNFELYKATCMNVTMGPLVIARTL